jgi:hypothetical protein
MNLNKPQQLWYLLNRFDREESDEVNMLLADQEAFPFFYLLHWNFNHGKAVLRRTALQSPIRSQFQSIHGNAPDYSYNLNKPNNQSDIIEEFLQKLPSLSKPKKIAGADDGEHIDDLSEIQWSPPVSETFAIILTKQQKYQQAIKIYEQLILAKPEKRLYFATRISELEQNLNE